MESTTVAQVLIPEAAYKLTPELEKIDKLLQDECYEYPIVDRFNTQRRRPSVPVRVYIRMMFLKHYAGLSYEDLTPEVTHNLMYRFFCRIPIEQKVPAPTALIKITTKYGEEVTRIKQACGKASRQSTASIRKMKNHLLSINKVLRRRTDDVRTEVRKITSQMAEEARKVLTQTDRLAKKLVPETENDLKIRGNLPDTAKKVRKIVEQSEAVNSGNTKLADRLISLKYPDARPIVKGMLGKRVEFGYKLQIQEIEGGIITGYQMYKGNPCDKIPGKDALQKHINLFGQAPSEMTLDRGYYDSGNKTLAYEAGVRHICIPKIGRKSKERVAFENTPTFRRLKRWRSGIEGRISCLKRRFGLNCSMLSGYRRTQTWTGFGILAHNLRQAAKMRA